MEDTGRQQESIALDADRLKALAHPTRLRLLTLLRDRGPATATELARLLEGVTSGTTSYHLRFLAVHGFVGETPEQPKGRDRRWQALHTATRFNIPELMSDPATGGAMQTLLHETLALHMEWLNAWLEKASVQDQAWIEAAAFTDYALRLSPDQLKTLSEELRSAVERYETGPPADDAEQVVALFYAFPRVDQLAGRAR